MAQKPTRRESAQLIAKQVTSNIVDLSGKEFQSIAEEDPTEELSKGITSHAVGSVLHFVKQGYFENQFEEAKEFAAEVCSWRFLFLFFFISLLLPEAKFFVPHDASQVVQELEKNISEETAKLDEAHRSAVDRISKLVASNLISNVVPKSLPILFRVTPTYLCIVAFIDYS